MITQVKYGGYTATPSDYACPDGDLAMSLNILHNDGELSAMPSPTVAGSLSEGEKLIFIHVVNQNTRHLIINKGGEVSYKLLGGDSSFLISRYSVSDLKCTAMGNILCIYGAGVMEHYVFLGGTYKPFRADDFNVTLHFGLESYVVSNSQKITRLLKDAKGTVVGEKEELATHEFTDVTGITSFECILGYGATYSINIEKSTSTSTIYLRLELTLFDDSLKSFDAGIVGSEFSFTPEKQVKKITLSFYSDADYSVKFNSKFSGTAHVYKIINTASASVDYVFNNTEENRNSFLGLANQLIANCHELNRFILPFFVRYGFRMITGDIITVSPPILMEPNTDVVPFMALSDIKQDVDKNIWYNANVTAKAFSSKLKYRVKDKDKLKRLLAVEDLVESLVIAVSDPIYLYKQGATIEECANSIFYGTGRSNTESYSIGGILSLETNSVKYLSLPHFPVYDYTEKLASVNAFHIVKEIKKGDISTSDSFVDVPLESGALKGLAANLNLLPDNTESLNKYTASYAMTYNQREHWINIIEEAFAGFELDAMCGFVTSPHGEHYANYEVVVKDMDGTEKTISPGAHTVSSSNRRWFFCIDSKASRFSVSDFSDGSVHALSSGNALTPHPFLKGSYKAFLGQWSGSGASLISKPRSTTTTVKENMLYVTMQSNPILVEQRMRIGDGCLYAAAANARPITRNQFGQAPLYVLSSDGVWALELSGDGRYSVRQPVSRDVCINPGSITSLDTSILFVTDRGIMLLSGTDTTCISDVLLNKESFNISVLGKGLTDYLSTVGINVPSIVLFAYYMKGCSIIYDYAGQRIIVFNSSYEYSYVYSLKDKTWGIIGRSFSYTVNAYPDTWAVDGEGNVLKYTIRQDADFQQKGIIITRPLKLDTPDILKVVGTVIQRGVIERGHVGSIVYGSNDLVSWNLVFSSTDHYIKGYRSTPYKYFRIVLVCNLLPSESIHGCTIDFKPILTNRIR